MGLIFQLQLFHDPPLTLNEIYLAIALIVLLLIVSSLALIISSRDSKGQQQQKIMFV